MRIRNLPGTAYLLLAILLISAYSIDGTKINGRAVSVNWLHQYSGCGTPCYADGRWSGSLDLFTITSGKMSRVDTLISRSVGFCYSPSFNLPGTKIAFYRLSKAQAGSSCNTTANGGKNTISVMDVNSRAIVNLCDLPGAPYMLQDGCGGLDWPAGDWIYYLMPNGGPLNEIWKVNASTKENSKVCTYSLGGGNFRRFSLNLAANRMGVQIRDGSWFTSDVEAFPNGCNITTRAGSCNSAISASGDYHAKFEGNHSQLILKLYPGVTGVKVPESGYTPYTLDIFAASTPETPFARDCEGLRWAVNSDKWVLQHVSTGHGDDTRWGSNQVACNWSEKFAIRISSNPVLPKDAGGCGDGDLHYGNCPGDLWVDGGAGNACSYEDASGVWHAVPGCTTDADCFPVAAPASRHLAAFRDANGNLRIECSFARSRVRIMDMRGTTVFAAFASGNLLVPAGTIPAGVYLISGQRGGKRFSTTVTVSQ